MSKLTKEITNSAISSIYNDYHPAYKNLYNIVIISSDNSDEINKYAQFHATAVRFGGEQLTLKRNPVTRQFTFDDNNLFKLSDTLEITWRESDDWRVKQFHDSWLSSFYNKENDYYISYTDDTVNKLYKKIIIQFPKPEGNDIPYYNDCLVLEKVLPNNNGGFDLAWSTSGDIVTHTMTYYVTNWYWTLGSIEDIINNSTQEYTD